jgi:uncharacterized protein DUF4386
MNKGRIAGVFYLLNFVTGSVALVFVQRKLFVYADATVLVAALCYVAVTLLFYDIFKPVNSRLSWLAAIVSLVGCGVSALSAFHLAPPNINPLGFFGFYCALIGYLVFKSTFLPRTLGALLAVGGLSWMTFLSPPLAHSLSPYNFAPGIFAEGALTVWLLVRGVDVPEIAKAANAA